jgi:hypothetical protein
MKCKVGQRYLIKSLRKKKNSDWDIQKILFFVVENKGYRADSNLVPSTLRVVTATLVLPHLKEFTDITYTPTFLFISVNPSHNFFATEPQIFIIP